jgi:hypothetical protein
MLRAGQTFPAYETVPVQKCALPETVLRNTAELKAGARLISA